MVAYNMLRVGRLDGAANALPSSQGMWQSAGKASSWFNTPNFMLEHVMGSPEQLKPCNKTAMDLITKPQRDILVFCVGNNKSATWSKVKEPFSELKSFQPRNLPKISQEASLQDSIVLNQQSGDACSPPSSESCNQISRGLHMPVQLPSEPQCINGTSHATHVLQSQSGFFVHEELDVDDEFLGHLSGRIEPSLENEGVNEGIGDSVMPPMEARDQVAALECTALLSVSRNRDEGEVPQTSDSATEAHENAGIFNTSERARQSSRAFLHVDKEHYALADGFISSNEYVETPGSMHGMTASLSAEDRQSVSLEYHIEDEDEFKRPIVGEDLEKSVNASCSSADTATLRLPAYRLPTHLQHSPSDNVVYLESLGVDWSRVFQIEPRISGFTVKQIRAIVSALEQYGLKWTDTGRLFNICPKILLLDPDRDLKAVTNFLFNEAGILPKDFRKVVRRCPRLLVADVKMQLRPTLSFLRSLGYPKISHTIANNPSLLSFDVKTRLIPRLRLLESWGFTYREAAAIASRFPAIFNYSATDNLQRKYDYLIKEIGGDKDDLLAFPQYFGFSLDWRIRPRHQTIVKLNVSLSIQAMLMLPEAEFSASFLCVDAGDNGYRRGSLYKSIKKKLHERSMKSVKGTKLESVEARVLVSA